MRWRGLALPRGPGHPIARGPNASQPPPVSDSAVSTGRPALPASPSVSLGLNPSSVVRNFYCQPHPLHKAFPPSLQDSFVVHRTSAVYPLCTVPFHWTVHRSIHSSCGLPPGRQLLTLRLLAACSEGPQRQPGDDRYINDVEGQPMTPDAQPARVPPDPADRAAARDRNRARVRTATAAAGLASVLAAGAVAYSLPGSTHTAAASTQHSSSGSSSRSGSSGASSSSSGSAGSSSAKSSSGSGLKSTSAPSASSGSGTVTSGGS